MLPGAHFHCNLSLGACLDRWFTFSHHSHDRHIGHWIPVRSAAKGKAHNFPKNLT